ncbi:MAG: hypothetical protein ACREVE_15515 [Gammaproteobacteria bacterium]
MTAATINIDFDKLLEVALKGVRRASVFMGLGVNAAIDKDFKNYQLSPLTNIQLVPDNVPEENLKHIKEEFRVWIEAGGFRELADTFARYLDSVHHTCLVMKAVREKTSVTDFSDVHLKFRSEGFPNKLNILQQRFSVGPAHGPQLISLSRARNCLTHRNGIVGEEDLRGETEFSAKWHGMDVFIEEPNGKRHPFNETPPEGLLLPEGGSVKMQFVERVRSFKRGEKLLLSTRDLAEVCWFYDRKARSVLKSVVAFARSIGIEPQEKAT